ncbi:MAG: hypothetical protein QOF99_8836, partial [Pseudonocardiales bacterium]|nr:hypothetical protein [Pseudonocardiales bacterium]
MRDSAGSARRQRRSRPHQPPVAPPDDPVSEAEHSPAVPPHMLCTVTTVARPHAPGECPAGGQLEPASRSRRFGARDMQDFTSCENSGYYLERRSP